MSIIHEKTRRFVANSLFPSFIHASLGLLLAQVGAARIHGAWSLHVVLGCVGLALLGHVLFRARMHWGGLNTDIPELRANALRPYLLLFAAGACVGLMVSSGSALLLGVGAALTYLVPWTKITLCRARFVLSAAVVLAGAVPWVLMNVRPVPPLHFIAVGWMLYIAPMFMQVLVLASLSHGYRIQEFRPIVASDLDAHVPLPH